MPSHGFSFEARRTSMSRLPSSLLRLTLRRLQHQRRRSEELAASQTADVVVLSCGTTATKGEAVMDCLTISQLKQIVRWTLQQYWANRDDDATRRRDEDDAALLFSPTSSRQASSPRHVHFAPAGRPKRRTASSPKSGSRLGMKDGVSSAELAVPQQAVAALAEECVRLAQNMAELVVGYSLLRVKVDETDVAQVNNAPKPFDIHRLHESVGSGWVYHESLSFAGDGGNVTRDCLVFRLHHIQSISYHEKTIVMQGVLAALLTAEKTYEKRRKSLQASSALKVSDEARAKSETSDGGSSSTTTGVSSSLESWLEDKHDSLGLVFDLRFVSLVSIERWEQRQLLMDCIMMLQESYPASVASVTVFCSTNLMRAAVEELVRTLHKDTALPITVRSRSHHVDLHSLTPLSTRPIVVDIFVVPAPSPSTTIDNSDNISREAWEGSWQRAAQRFKVDESVGSPSRGSSLSRGATTSLPRSSASSDPNWPFLNAVAAAILPAETDGSGFLRWWGDLVNARAEQINDWFDEQHPSAGGSVMRLARSSQRFDREALAFGYAGEHYDSPSGSSASSSSDSNSDSDDMNDDSVRSSRNRPRVPPPPAAASDSEDSPFRSATVQLQTEDVRLQESEEEDLPQEGPEEDPLTESQWNEAALENDFPSSSNEQDSSRSNSNDSPPLLGTGEANVLPPMDSDEEEEDFGPVEEGSLSGSSSSSTSASSSSPKSPDARSLQGESNTGGGWDEKDWAGEVREQSRAWRSEPQEHVLLHDKRYLAAQETAARLQIANDASDLWHVLLEDAAVELEAVRAVVRMQRNARLPFAMKVLREAENSARRALDLACVCEFHHLLDLAVQHRKQLADFEEQRWKLEYQEASQRGIVRAQELRSRDFISSADFDGSEMMSPSSQEPLLRSNEEERDSLQVSRREDGVDDETAADPPLTLDEQDCSNDMTVDRSSTTTVHYENSQLLQTTEASFLPSSPNPQNLSHHNNGKDDDEEDSASFPSPIRTQEETTEALLMGPAMLTSGQRREVLREVGVEETRRGLQPLLAPPQPQREPLRELSSDEPIVVGSPEIVYNGYEEF